MHRQNWHENINYSFLKQFFICLHYLLKSTECLNVQINIPFDIILVGGDKVLLKTNAFTKISAINNIGL